jgi:NDP-mannose synthase
MKAVILAGGKGMRLRPYTSILPKPLMPIGEYPVLEIILRQLVHYGVTDVTIAIGYLGSLIQTYLAQSPISRRLDIRYHTEDKPLGTAGAIGLIGGLTEPFFVMNGDLLTTVNFAEMMAAHKSRNADLTVGVVKSSVQIQLGVLDIGRSGMITGYDEKPTKTYSASMGAYVYSPSILEMIEPGAYLDAPSLVLKLIAADRKVFGYTADFQWIDIGNVGEYERAQLEFEKDPSQFLPGETDR